MYSTIGTGATFTASMVAGIAGYRAAPNCFDLGGTTFTTSGGDDNGVVTAGASATYSLYSRSRDAFLSSSIIPSVGLDLNETRVIKSRSSLSIE